MKMVSPAAAFAFAFAWMLFSIAGCDPMRRINIINQSGRIAEVIWVIREDSILKSPFFYSVSDSVVFSLKSNKPYNLVKMSFGTGYWSADELIKITDDLKLMEIRAASGVIKLDSPEEINTFLALRRQGIDNSKIRIVIK